MKRFLIYLGRWQLSSIVLWPCILLIPNNALLAAIFSNFVGGCIFFWIDKWIFSNKPALRLNFINQNPNQTIEQIRNLDL